MSIYPLRVSTLSLKLPSREWVGVLAITLLALGFNLLTYDLFPTVWCDDVSFSEPAFNFALYGSYTTTVWQFQPLNTFPVVNCPLYPMLLAGWLWVFGADLFSVRALNYVLISVAGLLFWQMLLRFKLVHSARWRMALMAAFYSGFGISFAYRCSRPDPLGIVLTLVLVLLFSVRCPRARSWGLFGVAAVLPWASLTSGLYAGLACFCSVIVMRRPGFNQAIALWIGLVVGVVSVFVFFQSKGILQYFVTGASHVVGNHYVVPGQATILTKVLSVLNGTWPEYPRDYSLVILMAGTLLLAVLKWDRLKTGVNWRLVGCSTLILCVTPIFFNFVGNYSFFYAYTLFIPALLIFASIAGISALSPSNPMLDKLASAVAVMAIVLSSIVGLPLRLGLVWYFTNVSPQTSLQENVNSCINKNDVVYTEESAFFYVKPTAKVVYTRWSSMDFQKTRVPGRTFTQSEKNSLTKLVIQPGQADTFTKFFGGEWEAMAVPFGDSTRWDRVENIPWIKEMLGNYLEQGHTYRRQLQIFRRK